MDTDSDNDCGSDLSMSSDSKMVKQGHMLHSVLTDFLKYTDSTGASLNLCETILLLKNSIDENTKMQKELLNAIRHNKTTITKD